MLASPSLQVKDGSMLLATATKLGAARMVRTEMAKTLREAAYIKAALAEDTWPSHTPIAKKRKRTARVLA